MCEVEGVVALRTLAILTTDNTAVLRTASNSILNTLLRLYHKFLRHDSTEEQSMHWHYSCTLFITTSLTSADTPSATPCSICTATAATLM